MMAAHAAHAAAGCIGCHPGRQAVPHPANLPGPVACSNCHREEAANHERGIHGQASASGNAAAPTCQSCHGDAHSVPSAQTEQFRKGIAGLCGGCHSQEADDYNVSIHGTAAARGVVAAPVCTTCHGVHDIMPPTVETSPVSPVHVPQTCARCHGDVQLARRFNLPVSVVPSFQESFHGLALRAGLETVANCATCHGVHKILPASDLRSTVNPRNLPATCGRCHPGAGTRFAITPVHWIAGRAEPVPVQWVRVAYSILIPLVIGLMLLHGGGDWIRKIIELRLRPSVLTPPPRTPARGPATFRMFRAERIQHGVLILSFVVLAWSGFALRYPSAWWARPLIRSELQWNLRGEVHRAAAAVFLALSACHAISLTSSRRLRDHWKTLWPKHKDLSEAVLSFYYNLGLLPRRPPISSHSYIEKVEYWALLWGAVTMSVTGLVLWANTLVMRVSSKLVLDVATAIHFYEAILATAAIAVWHFYYVIFDPNVYPVDPAFLTGYSVRVRPPTPTGGRDDVPPRPNSR
ncbi:MAG TPA: cytochrome b/b6 domain-containing protein [Bryobacteraceae bacterium]|nr:cytochrome b/b6 domain-containing protein [Bryobacteraceae bacterium]